MGSRAIEYLPGRPDTYELNTLSFPPPRVVKVNSPASLLPSMLTRATKDCPGIQAQRMRTSSAGLEDPGSKGTLSGTGGIVNNYLINFVNKVTTSPWRRAPHGALARGEGSGTPLSETGLEVIDAAPMPLAAAGPALPGYCNFFT